MCLKEGCGQAVINVDSRKLLLKHISHEATRKAVLESPNYSTLRVYISLGLVKGCLIQALQEMVLVVGRHRCAHHDDATNC